MSASHSSSDTLHRLADLLAEHHPLLATHPNDCDLSVLPSSWTASSTELTRYYTTGEDGEQLPETLKTLIDGIRRLQLPREPIDMKEGRLFSLPTKKGMSPKKLHEVQRMASYVKTLVDEVQATRRGPHGQIHIVDVGAGQGYLTRALGALFPDAKLLALDADHGQTEGAERRAKLPERKLDSLAEDTRNRIDHKTILITPESLLHAVDDWIKQREPGEAPKQSPVPVVFVGLHACGSLTPDMLRAFLSRISEGNSALRSWYPLSIVAVGCCYNLMYPEDYPLSDTLRSYKPAMEFRLPTSAFHLAAQIPMTWLERKPNDSELRLRPSVELSTRKIAWRAMLGFALQRPHQTRTLHSFIDSEKEAKTCNSSDVPVKWWTQPREDPSKRPAPSSDEITPDGPPGRPSFDRRLNVRSSEASPSGVGVTEMGLRLGKLPESAYTQGWSHFLSVTGKRLGVEWEFEDEQLTRDPTLEKRIETLHTVRCCLGSAVESAIILDRVQWVRERLLEMKEVRVDAEPSERAKDWDVVLVNLFDQELGSGRNVAIVIAPRISVLKT